MNRRQLCCKHYYQDCQLTRNAPARECMSQA